MVAATRSRVWEEFGAVSPRKTGVVPSLRGFTDQLARTEVSRNPRLDSTCLLNKSVASERCIKPRRTAGRQPVSKLKNNPDFKHDCRNAALHFGTNVDTVAQRAGAENDQLESQPIRNDVGGPTQSSEQRFTRPFPETTTPPATLKFGMYAGRVKANPLKYLATVLRSKLQPHYEACNLLQIATEIHDEAKNKHNTTLRRIYDVVNVLEAAGLLERNNGSIPKRSPRNQNRNECPSVRDTVTDSPSAESLKSTIEFGVDVKSECYDEQIDIYASPNQTFFSTEKRNQQERKSTRGSRIRWLPGSGFENEQRYHKQIVGRLTEEKIAAVQRISNKQRELEYLQEELRLSTELIKHNQIQMYQFNRFQNNIHPCTPPPEDLSCSYLNFEDCSQTSTETERSYGSLQFLTNIAPAVANEASATCGSSTKQESHPSLNRPSVVTEADGYYDFHPLASEVGMNILEATGQYQSNYLPRTISGTPQRGLHVPFVILQTKNTTNVDIDVASNETSEVSILLNDEYQLFDYRELLSAMFPAQNCDGGSSYIYAD